jgi:tRNA pseudouridine38-40 synthase
MFMQKYKIIVAYDGTDYCGWQKQNTDHYLPTVCQALEDSFYAVFGKRIALFGASRTDAGVHALGQVAQFCTDLQITPEKMFHAWTNKLPSDISIVSLVPVDKNFNLHLNIVHKIYQYHFFVVRPLPSVQRYGWYYRYPVSIEKLQEALNVFIGTHDFRSFCTGDEREDTVRTIFSTSVELVDQGDPLAPKKYRITVCGPKFLRYMVRRIVGACLHVASRADVPVSYLRTVLDEKDPEQTLPNAPAKGLLLHSILYKEESNTVK